MNAVNMGDKPSATIAQVASRKTAEAAADLYPESAELILDKSYMNDIPGSVKSKDELFQRMNELEEFWGQKVSRSKMVSQLQECLKGRILKQTSFSCSTVR